MKKPSTLRRVFRLVGKHRLPLVLSLLFSAVCAVLMLYVPILVGDAIDQIVGEGDVAFSVIGELLIRILVIVGACGVVRWLLGVINNRITYRVVEDIRNHAFYKLGRLPLGYLDGKTRGETVSRIITDVDTFADGLLLGFSQLFTGIVTILGTLIFMLWLSPLIACLVVVITPLSLVAARFIASRTYKMFRAQAEVRGEQTAFVDEMIGNCRVVAAYGREAANGEAFDEINGRLMKASLRATFFSSLTNPVTRFVNSVVYAAVALAGALAVISTVGDADPFTVGALTAFLSYANQYTKPFNEISGVITEFQNALASASRVFALLDEDEEIGDIEDATVLTEPEGKVAFRDVSFSYDPEKRLLEHIDLSVNPGERVAIVGPTGCGKTTLINLLMRFYDVRDGSILIDNMDLRTLRRRSLRENIGMVLQDSWIRHATVRENLAIGRPNATDEEIRAAARAAHCDSFILRFAEGYDTVLPEDGGSLSQGQKQLIAIARIMLFLPPMLILDEATSSIDTRTELKIQDAFARLMQGRTSFIVAHRLSTIKNADLILVMREGNIVEKGTHAELLRADGFYAHLYKSQFEK
jgi:ATP-binding cassette subfamily B protein